MAVKKESEHNIAQPSSIDPFQEVLKSLGKARRDSPSVSTPPPVSAATPPQMPPGLSKLGKKKKSVSWAPEGVLESVKFIDRAIYDDDPVDVSYFLYRRVVLYINVGVVAVLPFLIQGVHTSHSLRDLDRGEGAALMTHLFEETIDWYEPLRKQTNSCQVIML